MGKCLVYSGDGLWTNGVWGREAGGAASEPGSGGLKAPAAWAGPGHRCAHPPPSGCGEGGGPLRAASALRTSSACAPKAVSGFGKNPAHPALPHRESEAACARRAGVCQPARFGGGGGGVGRSEGERFLVPVREANRARLHAGRSRLPRPPPARVLPPPALSRRRAVPAARAAVRRPEPGGGRVSSRGRRASLRLCIAPGLCHHARGEWDRERARQCAETAPRSTGRAGRHRGPCLTRARRASRTSR